MPGLFIYYPVQEPGFIINEQDLVTDAQIIVKPCSLPLATDRLFVAKSERTSSLTCVHLQCV